MLFSLFDEMTLRLCFVLFIGSATLAAQLPNEADLHSVFGSLQGYQVPPNLANTKPVTPANNDTPVDTDYMDYDYYLPSSVNYDDFDWTVTKRVAAVSDENFLLSPLGLKLTMAILTEAATGATLAELSSVLGLDTNRTNVRNKFSSIVASMQSPSMDYDLNLGSRIYIEAGVEPTQRFSAISQEFYRTELQKLDFGQPLVAAGQINAWVSNITKGKIHNLISEDDIKDSVVLVLTTFFFKGTWRHQFNPNATNVGKFYLSPKLQKQVPFMNVKNKFYYAESAKYDAKILRLPYLGNKFSMFIIVPNSLTGLPRVMNSLADLRTEMLYLQERNVDVTIPKFNFDYTSILDGVLKEMGIRQAFEDTASFPGLARGQQLHQRLRISKVLQKSGMEINELGSIAYSATEVNLVNKFGEDDETAVEVIANKPFMFFIEDEATRQLLFTGRVSDPLSTVAAFKPV